jgi:amidase
MDDGAQTDLLFRPIGELAGLVRDGQVSSRELVQASLDRIEALNDRLNAFIHVDGEGALAAADGISRGDDRPYAGVPIAIKDLTAVRGMPVTLGSDFLGDHRPRNDSHLVRRVRDAGFVLMGITNMPEFGILPVTEPRRYGPTRNPWDTERTPGGSSGGSAAAVASGMVPVGHASDGGGSTRIPASCTGLVGLKPTRGRISLGPELGDNFTTVAGALTRTVGETAEMLDLLEGYELGDATWAPPHHEPFAGAAAREPGRMRIGFTMQPPLEAPVDAVNAAALRDATDLLVELGHEVEEFTPAWSIPGLLQLFTVVFGAQISLGVSFGALLAGREPTPEDVEPLSWELWKGANDLPAVGYMAALTQLQAAARGIVLSLAAYDAVLTPALAERPVPIGEIDACSDEPMRDFARSGQFTPFTAVANVTGLPAISLPLFHGDDGLPTAVQLIGPPAGEATLLCLGGQLERARPWADRRPALEPEPA